MNVQNNQNIKSHINTYSNTRQLSPDICQHCFVLK